MGAKLLWERVAERGKGVGARSVARGWGDGGGEGGGERGWGEALIKVLNKTGIVTLSLVIGMHITRRNWLKNAIRGISPIFGREFPCNDIIVSQKHHNLARKVRKRECERFHCMWLCKKEGRPSWKSEYVAHFEFLNSNISITNPSQVLIFLLEA